jgi:hypothetical protein
VTWLLDTNIFIAAAHREYGFDFCPAFWDWLIEANAAGKVHSLDKVLAELPPGDEVGDWAAARSKGFFLPLQPSDGPSLAHVANWARSGEFTAAAATEFLGIADSQLVAVAHARALTVVTHEVPSNSKQRIKVPTACVGLSVAYASPYQMLRKERARFVLGKSR